MPGKGTVILFFFFYSGRYPPSNWSSPRSSKRRNIFFWKGVQFWERANSYLKFFYFLQRKVSSIKLVLTSILQTPKQGTELAKVGETNQVLDQSVIPHNDFFSAQFLIPFAAAGIYLVLKCLMINLCRFVCLSVFISPSLPLPLSLSLSLWQPVSHPPQRLLLGPVSDSLCRGRNLPGKEVNND